MTQDEKIKAALTGKIDSFDAFVDALQSAGATTEYAQAAHNFYNTHPFGGYMTIADQRASFAERGIKKTWWHHREFLRQVTGVYPAPTEVMETLTAVFLLQPYHLHVSAEDPTMVAYTPSIEDGQRDRQVRTTFGKAIRKLCLTLTDDDIQLAESTHRSEMDPTFLVARSIKDIYRVYTDMDGDSGCMRYPASQFKWAAPMHPSNVYSGPGLGVAYTEFDGGIKSRAVIYENPADPTDKRYVRVYGDRALKRKLERAGYKLGTLQGAKLPAIPDPTREPGYYVMPYLDGPGGLQGDSEGCYVVKYKGEDFITIVSSTQANTLAAGGGSPARAKETGGILRLIEVDQEQFMFTCAISGQRVNRLENPQPTMKVWLNGTAANALYDVAVAAGYGDYTSKTYSGGSWVSVGITAEDSAKTVMRPGAYSSMIDTPENWAAAGYVKLSSVFGYDDTKHVPSSETLAIRRGDTTHYVLRAGAYIVIDAGGVRSVMHISEVGSLKKSKAYVSVPPIHDTKTLVHKDNPNLVTLVNGKRALKGEHEVSRRWDGAFDFTRNLRATSVFGHGVRVSRQVPRPEYTDEQLMDIVVRPMLQRAGEVSEEVGLRRAWLARYLRDNTRRGFIDISLVVDREDRLVQPAYDGSDFTLTTARRAVDVVERSTDEQIDEQLWPGAAPDVRAWARVFKVVHDGVMSSAEAGFVPTTRVEEAVA